MHTLKRKEKEEEEEDDYHHLYLNKKLSSLSAILQVYRNKRKTYHFF